MVKNLWNFAGILGGACLGIFIIYTPPLHVVFGGSFHLIPLYWLIPCAFGFLLLAWASIRVVLLRKGLEQSRVKDIQGLMMCTLFSFVVIFREFFLLIIFILNFVLSPRLLDFFFLILLYFCFLYSRICHSSDAYAPI